MALANELLAVGLSVGERVEDAVALRLPRTGPLVTADWSVAR